MRFRKTGLTLIEVMAAIGLLATLLGTVVVASTRHTRQLRLAQDRLAAQEVANDLLQVWLVTQQGAIEQARGEIPGRAGWEWRLSGRIEKGLEPFGLHVGRLQILHNRSREQIASNDTSITVLASVEFVSSSVITAEAAARGVQ